jgi:hypothetical protein
MAERPTPEDFIPPSANAVVFVNPVQLVGEPVSASALDWESLSSEIRSIGLDAAAASRVALATLSSFERGRGTLIVLRPESEVVLPSLSWDAEPAFVLEGLDFRTTSRSGWFWTGVPSRWVAAADSNGCVLAAGVLAGSSPSLFGAPPRPTLAPLLASLSAEEPFSGLLIPTGRTLSTMEAASTWTSDVMSLLDLALPSELLKRVGVAHGAELEGHDDSGGIQLLMRVAMTDQKSAEFVAGTVNLVSSLGSGLEALSRSLGNDAPPPPDVDLEVSCTENLLLVRTLVPPSRGNGR